MTLEYLPPTNHIASRRHPQVLSLLPSPPLGRRILLARRGRRGRRDPRSAWASPRSRPLNITSRSRSPTLFIPRTVVGRLEEGVSQRRRGAGGKSPRSTCRMHRCPLPPTTDSSQTAARQHSTRVGCLVKGQRGQTASTSAGEKHVESIDNFLQSMSIYPRGTRLMKG